MLTYIHEVPTVRKKGGQWHEELGRALLLDTRSVCVLAHFKVSKWSRSYADGSFT